MYQNTPRIPIQLFANQVIDTIHIQFRTNTTGITCGHTKTLMFVVVSPSMNKIIYKWLRHHSKGFVLSNQRLFSLRDAEGSNCKSSVYLKMPTNSIQFVPM